MSKENREVLVHVDHMKKYFPVRKKGVLKAVDDVSFNIYKGETLKRPADVRFSDFTRLRKGL